MFRRLARLEDTFGVIHLVCYCLQGMRRNAFGFHYDLVGRHHHGAATYRRSA